MLPEDLLKMLRDAGMDDEAIKKLLSDTMASLEGPAEEPTPEEQEKQAGELLGVEF